MYAYLQELHVATYDNLRAAIGLLYWHLMDQIQALLPHCNLSEDHLLKNNIAGTK